MSKDIEHNIFFENGVLYKSLLHSNWYDTATPYQYCIKELKEVSNSLKAGQTLKIESSGKTHIISTQEDFRNWIENVFYGGFEKYVFDN